MGQRFRTLPLDPTFFVFDLFFDLGPRSTLGWMRSGSVFLPVERFHSSYVWSEILPVTKSSANLRRWALLLNGIPAMLGNRENAVARLPGELAADHDREDRRSENNGSLFAGR